MYYLSTVLALILLMSFWQIAGTVDGVITLVGALGMCDVYICVSMYAKMKLCYVILYFIRIYIYVCAYVYDV